MSERRSLIEGLKQTPKIDPEIEHAFVYQNKQTHQAEAAPPQKPQAVALVISVGPRSPLSTRIRTDLAEALKRASLERQLNKVEPNTITDIMESVLEPWLKSNGYLN